MILHEGINEAGSIASFTAAGTSYATHGEPMIPIYIFYSMFGFQRTGDGFWAAGRPDGPRLRARRHRRPDHAQRRGPAARGRPLAAARVDQPGGASPTTRRSASRSAHIVEDGLRRMYGDDAGERLLLPDPLQRAVRAAGRARGRRRRRASCAGIYRYSAAPDGDGPQAQLLASGVAVPWALRGAAAAARGLGRAGRRLVGDLLDRAAPRRRSTPTSTTCCNPDERAAGAVRHRSALAGRPGPVVAVSDCMRAVQDQIAPLGAGRLHLAGHRRLRPLRHPRRAAPALPRRRRVDRGARRSASSPGAARSTPTPRARRSTAVPARRRRRAADPGQGMGDA